MTVINLTVLADALGNATPIDAVLEAEATSARTVGAEARTPQKIVVPITAGAPSKPLNLEGTGIGWCWKLTLMVPATGFRVTRFVQVPATGTVTWEDLVDVNPLTLKVLPDAVPAWKAAMDDLLAARDAAVLAESAAGAARDDAVAAKDLAISTVADVALTADTALTNAALAQAKADAALPVHLPPATGTNLNTLTAVGVHPVPWLTGTLALNFPIASTAGIVEVLPYDSVKLIQRFTPTTGTSATRGTWTRRRTDTSTWGVWVFQPTQRIDNTAGRAIYTWDETQNRETLLSYDSGWRDVTELIPEVTAGSVALLREGYTVTLSLTDVVLGTQTGTVNLSALLPTGFRPHRPENVAVHSSPSSWLRGLTLTSGTLRIYGATSGATLNARSVSRTNDRIPTTLPGTASGTIPHN